MQQWALPEEEASTALRTRCLRGVVLLKTNSGEGHNRKATAKKNLMQLILNLMQANSELMQAQDPVSAV